MYRILAAELIRHLDKVLIAMLLFGMCAFIGAVYNRGERSRTEPIGKPAIVPGIGIAR